MPCQCGTSTTVASDAGTTYSGCGCGTEPSAACDCAGSPAPSERERSLERVVMELDKRVRRLESRG